MRTLGNARDMGTPRSARRSAAAGEGTRVLAGRRTVSGPLANGRTLSIFRRKPSPLNPAAAGSGYRRTINCGHAPRVRPPPHSSVSMFVAMMLPSG